MERDDPIEDALTSLHLRRAELQREVNRLNEAIVALEALERDAITVPVVSPSIAAIRRRTNAPGRRVSVKQMMLELLYDSGRDWSVNEILDEYKRRGTPIQAKDPSNALRAAVAEENKAGTIKRTAPGRYIASIYDAGPAHGDDSMASIVSGGPHPENDPQGVMEEMADDVRRSIGHNRFTEDAPG